MHMTTAKAEGRRSLAALGSILRFLAIFLAFAASPLFAVKPNVVRVAILSKVDEELAVYWINTWKQNELVRQKEEAIVARGSLNVDSYKSHSFLIIEEEHIEGLTKYTPAMWNPKIMTMFTMGEFDLEARVSRDERGNLKVDLESALTRTEALMAAATESCRQSPEVVKAVARRRGLAAAEGSCVIGAAGDPNEMTPEFSACLARVVAEDLAKKETEANKSMRMLEAVGDRARNYTCVDPNMETTNTSLPTVTWVDPQGGMSYDAKVFLDEPAAKIYLLDNFASPEECQSLMKKASPHLQDATVNAGAGKSELSSARRAKAGGVNAELDDPKSVTAPLYRRGYAFANHVTGYDMDMAGQEGFSVIKYGPNDEYRPHCDGDCTGAEHQPGGRIATMVIYCEAAKLGGGTTFSSSDVFVKAKKGQAVFFSYLGPDNRTDTGRTRHSGCPIIKGTKWIATLWMRRGTSAERDWRYYDPSGMPSAFALSRMKGQISKEDEAQVQAQKSVVDGPENANSGTTETVKQNQGVDESNGSTCSDGSTCDGRTTAAAGGGGEAEKKTDKVDGSVLGGIADSISSLWS